VITTVTPNPSVDRTVTVDAVARGAVNRARSVRVDPGGKGVNVSRALAAHGTATTAVLPTGGPEGRVLHALLADSGVGVVDVPICTATRANISIVEPDGTTTKLNEPGPALTRDDEARLLDAVVAELAQRPAWLVGSGSLPPGVGADFYARLVAAAHEQGVPAAIDTSRAPLVLAARAGADLLKPNDEELAQAVARPLPTLGDAIAAAQQLRAPGTQVIVSLGARGALLVDDRGAVLAAARMPRPPLSTVGAGDSLLAGYLHAGTRDAAALAVGVAWGTAAVSLPGSQMPAPADVAGIDVTLSDPPESLVLLPA
jgi:1-phosphofructokinase family hexose kinase